MPALVGPYQTGSLIGFLSEQWKLVKEALRERRIFLDTAPHLSHMLP